MDCFQKGARRKTLDIMMSAIHGRKQVGGRKNWTQIPLLCWVPVVPPGSAVLGAGQSVHLQAGPWCRPVVGGRLAEAAAAVAVGAACDPGGSGLFGY